MYAEDGKGEAMSDAIRGQCRLCGKPEESHHWHPLAHGGIVRNGRPGYLHCPTNSCDVCTECGENREKHRCPNGATFYTAHSVAQPAPIAGEGELVERITGHLASGGLFNPEMAIHDRVRDLLIDCRHALEIRAERVKEAVEAEREACAKVAYKTPFRCHAEDDGDFHSGCVQTRDGIVDAIRSRGDKEGT